MAVVIHMRQKNR